MTGARPIPRSGGSGKDNESPSELKQRERKGVHGKNDGEILVSYNKLPTILKPLASIMLFGSADGDQNKAVEERRRELVLQYMSYNNGATLPEKEYYRYLARVLKEWHTDVQEQEEERSMEIGFRRLFRIISVMKKILSWFRSCIRSISDFVGNIFSCNWTWQMPWFEIILLLCVVGVVLSVLGILFFPFYLIWKCLFRRPDPPPSPPPFNPSVVKKLLPFISPDIVKKWLPIDPSTVVKDLFPFINFDIVKNWLPIDPIVLKDLLPLNSVRLVMLATQLKIFIPMMIMVAAVK